MAVPRAQLGGPFGGGPVASSAPSIDVAGAIDAAVNGASSLLQNALIRKIAERREARETQRLQLDMQREARADELQRATFQQKETQGQADAALKQATLQETNRHNQATEDTGRLKGMPRLRSVPVPKETILDKERRKAALIQAGAPDNIATAAAENQTAYDQTLARLTDRKLPRLKTATTRDSGANARQRQAWVARRASELARPSKDRMGKSTPGIGMSQATTQAETEAVQLFDHKQPAPPAPSIRDTGTGGVIIRGGRITQPPTPKESPAAERERLTYEGIQDEISDRFERGEIDEAMRASLEQQAEAIYEQRKQGKKP